MLVHGPRFTLRYPAPGDVPALFELGQDPEVTRFFSWGPYTDESQPRAFIDHVTAQREAGERLEFAIADRDDRIVGITGLSEFSLRDRRATVGTWLGRPYWGSGANAESKALILRLGFERLGLLRATALASPDNARSLAALERLGFEPEGVLRAWHVHGGEQRDVAILRLMREDFEAGPLAKVPVDIEGEPPPAFVAG
ncbi:MAG: [ribosomal protein S5]-alanine N-acetyltransferase [Thermoleophilaceae bacterium]|nr:[ribosomal protein S5]-alanine N-acetyltransferase [Thermoleophilaceae bacterium]